MEFGDSYIRCCNITGMNEMTTVLREELSHREWAQADLARVLNWPVQAMSEIMQGKRRVDAGMALDLAALTDRSASDWLAIQNAVDLEDARRRFADRGQRISARAALEDIVPVRELIRRGVISRSDPDTQAAEVAELIGDDRTFGASAKRSLTEMPFSRAQTAWIALARRKAKALSLAQFDDPGFSGFVRALPQFANEPEDFASLPKRFAELGVALVHIEAFPGGRIDGVSLAIGDNPMIALSGRGKRFDKVMFTLLHECAHVVEGHWRDAPRLHEDGREFIVGDRLVENQVDALAAEWCFPGGLSKQRPVTRQHIAALAAKYGVAEALVIGNLQHNQIIEWSSALSRGLPTVEEELKLWA